MNKFPYKYDINKYIDKACEKILYTYFWFTKDMLDERYEYIIEKEDDEYEFISYYTYPDGTKSRNVLKWIKTPDDFYNKIIYDSEFKIVSFNPVKKEFHVPKDSVINLHGWYLEIYDIRLHELGSYSVYVQAGDRTAGASRTFYLPQDYFKGNYSEFLDKYMELIPASSFGIKREVLENNKDIKRFLGFK